MKKILAVMMAAMIVFSCMSFVTFAAEETYDSTWSISIKNQDGDTSDFAPGDLLEVQIINGTALANKLDDTTVHFTYNSDALEMLSDSDDDIDAIYYAFGVEDNALCLLSGTYTNNMDVPGVFKWVFVTESAVRVRDNTAMFKIYFKVKEGLAGRVPLNFKWIHTGENRSYASVSEVEYKINFADSYYEAVGDQITENEPTQLPTEGINSRPYAFVPATNPTVENPLAVSMNGTTLNVTTPYLVVFSKVAIRNFAAEEVGMLISKDNTSDMNEDTPGVKKAVALNISSANHFGVLFHGEALEAGKTYYTRAYAKYTDGTVLFGAVVPVTLAD